MRASGPTSRRRRRRIAAYHGRGLTVIEIATKLGISNQGVYHHLNALGLKPNRKRPTRIRKRARVAS